MLHVRAQVLIHEKIYFLDRFGRVKLLRWGTSALCVDLLYTALMTRYFAGSDNNVGKGLAVLRIYLFTAIYCEYLSPYTSITSSEFAAKRPRAK